MENVTRFILGILLGVVGIAGLFLAANSEQTRWYYYGGLGVFAVNDLVILGLIRNTWPKRRYQ